MKSHPARAIDNSATCVVCSVTEREVDTVKGRFLGSDFFQVRSLDDMAGVSIAATPSRLNGAEQRDAGTVTSKPWIQITNCEAVLFRPVKFSCAYLAATACLRTEVIAC